jgi:hypothetical protein
MFWKALSIAASLSISTANAQDREASILYQNQYDLSGPGRIFLLNEARAVNFFMLGELHGEREIPDIIISIWPDLYRNGYRHIAAEVSEWAAVKLEFSKGKDSLKVEGLWTNREARYIQSLSGRNGVLWGCDMEEISPGDMIREFIANVGTDKVSSDVLAAISQEYNRSLAPKLLRGMNSAGMQNKFGKDRLCQLIVTSLRIDSARAFPESRFKAQLLREQLMKMSFIKNYEQSSKDKVFLRFGRNHLHYGFDERGISTLGNFVAELSIAKNLKCFNVAAFAAGGKCRLMGEIFSADERADDLAFQFLSERSTYNTAIFDLRPLRAFLHTVNSEKRTDLQRRLLYWADTYDAIICFKEVTPR